MVYHDYWLSAYGIDGRIGCRTLLVSDVTATSIRILWP